MAYSLVSGVVSQLSNLVIQEAVSLACVRCQIQRVKTKLDFLQGFLKDADSRRKRGDERMETWIRAIRGVAYEMEVVIDTVNYMREWRHQRRGFMGTISRYSHKPCELITLQKISCRIKQIMEKIRDIDEMRAACGIANLGESGVDKSNDWDDNLQKLRQFPDNFFDDTDVIGFDDDKENLVKLLVDPENKKRSVISIVGMGGLGKTTLARTVYNIAEGKQHFDTCVWLNISQKYDVEAILKDIVKKKISSVTTEELEKMTEEELKEKVYNFFKDTKYFVGMDDVWEVLVWERIGQVFPNKNNGSRVLLTTRNIEVAKSIDPSMHPYELHFLEDTESWELFRRKAFPDQDIPDELQGVGWNLAKKCGGLPLALVVLGAFMSDRERSYPTWSEVDKSIEWEFMDKGKRCLDILALSYNDLPHQLKSCFLYIAAFPEDSIISSSKLVRLWTAEGFIPQRPKRTLEETARNCLDELVQRCMIQAVEKSIAYGRVKSMRIHDMLREVGISEARNDEFLHVCSGDVAAFNGISSRRAAFHDHINDKVADSSPYLRTLLGFNLVLTNAGRFLNGFNLLRVLDLEGAKGLQELPEQIGNMIHLRYLGLRRTLLKSFPSSIRRLLNLQTLDARNTDIRFLPKLFWKIRMLKHLYIYTSMCLDASIIDDHNNLQTLHIWDNLQGVRVTTRPDLYSEESYKMVGKSLKTALEKMDSLVSLTLELQIGQIPWDVLQKMHRLRSLELEARLLLKPQQLLNSSQFLPNLTKLILSYSELELDPMPMLEKLSNIRLLTLKCNAYIGKSMSCSSGGFPQLRYLTLMGLHSLEGWTVEVGAMRGLTHLTLDYCRNLKMLPEGLQYVTTLRELKLHDMSLEFEESVRNQDGYKVGHMPFIIFEEDD